MFKQTSKLALLLFFVLAMGSTLAAQNKKSPNKKSAIKAPIKKKSAMDTLRSAWNSRVMTIIKDCGLQSGTLVQKMHSSVQDKNTGRFDDFMVFLKQSYKVYKKCKYLFYLKTQGKCYKFVKNAGKEIKAEAKLIKEMNNRGDYLEEKVKNSEQVKVSLQQKFDAIIANCKVIYNQKKLPKHLRDDIADEDIQFEKEDIEETEEYEGIFGNIKI